jgi:hypothetical protein
LARLLVKTLNMLFECPNAILRKHFRCNRFRLLLDFARSGGVTGKLFPFKSVPSISVDVSGLYLDVNDCTALALNCDFSNPNVEGATQMHFSGEVFNYDGQRECLIIRWLANQKFGWFETCDRDIEILLDSPIGDEHIEMIKIREHLKLHPLQLIN